MASRPIPALVPAPESPTQLGFGHQARCISNFVENSYGVNRINFPQPASTVPLPYAVLVRVAPISDIDTNQLSPPSPIFSSSLLPPLTRPAKHALCSLCYLEYFLILFYFFLNFFQSTTALSLVFGIVTAKNYRTATASFNPHSSHRRPRFGFCYATYKQIHCRLQSTINITTILRSATHSVLSALLTNQFDTKNYYFRA